MMNFFGLFVVLGVQTLATNKLQYPYFLIKEGKSKCFVENTANVLPITVSYGTYDNPGIVCSLRIYDPREFLVLNVSVPHMETYARETYLTKSEGAHKICIECPSSKWFNQASTKWHLSVDLGDFEMNQQDVATAHDVQSSESMMKVLLTKMKKLVADYQYNEKFVDELNTATKNLSKRVGLTTMIQMVIIIVSSYVLMYRMKRFFQKKNYVN